MAIKNQGRGVASIIYEGSINEDVTCIVRLVLPKNFIQTF